MRRGSREKEVGGKPDREVRKRSSSISSGRSKNGSAIRWATRLDRSGSKHPPRPRPPSTVDQSRMDVELAPRGDCGGLETDEGPSVPCGVRSEASNWQPARPRSAAAARYPAADTPVSTATAVSCSHTRPGAPFILSPSFLLTPTLQPGCLNSSCTFLALLANAPAFFSFCHVLDDEDC